MTENNSVPDLKELCLHSICAQLLIADGFYDIKSSLKFLSPRLIETLELYYQANIQPQIGKWRRCHLQFFNDVQEYFSLGGQGETCKNGKIILDIVTDFNQYSWTPFLTIDYARTAICMSELMPKTCEHLSKWSVPNCDPTTCRDGLEFDSEI